MKATIRIVRRDDSSATRRRYLPLDEWGIYCPRIESATVARQIIARARRHGDQTDLRVQWTLTADRQAPHA